MLAVGIENDAETPPPGQRIPLGLTETVRRRVGELTVNVAIVAKVKTCPNGGEYIALHVPRAMSVPSTTDGRYFIRDGDKSRPVVGDEVLRLVTDRSGFAWEVQTSLQVPREAVDAEKIAAFCRGIRSSDRVKASVKEKSDEELLDHYLMSVGPWMTNLGVLCVGRREDRARVGTAPVVQFLKFDEQGARIRKLVWDGFTLSPMEIVDAVWAEVPDFRETYELPEGMFRRSVPMFDEKVIRELLVNALVHRPYTQRGDIFINVHPDRLEMVNPGRLPVGVTPSNILHTTVRRNEHLARVFHDLMRMEREGTGYDLLYEVLLGQGRSAPEVLEGPDRVEVVVRRRIMKPEAIDLMGRADQQFQLRQRESICLGLLAQHEHLTARQLAEHLMLPEASSVGSWLGRLGELGLVRHSGRTQAVRYFIAPEVLRGGRMVAATTLGRIEPHRLRALIVEDLGRYPGSSSGDVGKRIGKEIDYKRVKRALDQLVDTGVVRFEGDKKWRRYWLFG
jgi:ATP-dependent DNA helicase RecG